MELLKYFVAVVMTFISIAAAAGESPKGLKDHWPWEWGSECPFPWQGIDGSWRVSTVVEESAEYSDQVLEFVVVDRGSNGSRLLQVNQYNALGRLLASGEGVSKNSDRIITAYMTPTQVGKKAYKVMVRSYLKNALSAKGRALCKSSDSVMAVTFCPVRGRKCMDDSNYVLTRE